MFKRTVCLIIALLVTTHCYAGTIHHSIPDSNYTKYANGINCVVPIKGTFKEENGSTTYFVASCVIIRERWIATAAHVVSFKGMSYEIKVGDEYRSVVVETFEESFLKKLRGQCESDENSKR